jgi:hypothetical protein
MADRHIHKTELASLALLITSLFFAISIAIGYSGGSKQLQTILGILGVAGLSLLLLPRSKPEERAERLGEPQEATTPQEIINAYIQARTREISQKGEPRKTALPCTPAVQTLVEAVIKLSEQGKPLQALALLESQKLLEGKFREKESIYSRLKSVNYSLVIAVLSFGVGTLFYFGKCFLNSEVNAL